MSASTAAFPESSRRAFSLDAAAKGWARRAMPRPLSPAGCRRAL
jgi:hypothetical protein